MSRTCQIGGIWSPPSAGNCVAHAGDPLGDSCQYGEKCQTSSYCGYAPNSNKKTCLCSAGYISKLNPSSLQYDCILQDKYVGETCEIAPQCQGGSVCDSPTCNCPPGLDTEYDSWLSRTVCVGGTASPGEDCKHDETCVGGSICQDGQCTCEAGMKASLNNATMKYACVPRPSYLGESCANEEVCLGGSECDGTECSCPTGREAKYDGTTGKHMCVQEAAAPHDSCSNGEICGGGSECINGVCTCKAPFNIVSDDGECVGGFSEVYDSCNRRHPCHPLTQAVCLNYNCTCINPLYHDLDFDVCRSSSLLDGRGTQEYNETCDAVFQCRSSQFTSCVKGRCACTGRKTFREGKCLAPGVCVTVGTFWDKSIGDCRMPGEGEKCSVACKPDYLQCIDGKCRTPGLGEKCSSVCANQTTMSCTNSVCACKPGFNVSQDNQTCDEMPAHPGWYFIYRSPPPADRKQSLSI